VQKSINTYIVQEIQRAIDERYQERFLDLKSVSMPSSIYSEEQNLWEGS
jgi:hypothetical protein